MLKKYRYFLLAVTYITIGVLFYKNCNGKIRKHTSIIYSEQHVKQLSEVEEGDSYWKKRNVLLKKVEELEDSLAEVYQLTGNNGIGWSKDTGDFVRINFKLRNRRIAQFDNLGGWIRITEQRSKSLPNSPKIKSHPYGITLDMEKEGQILILIGASPNDVLTLIYILKDTAEVIFNKEILDLSDVLETERGYLLRGQLYSGEFVNWEDRGVYASYPGQAYEILIENNQLSFHELPSFDKDRLNLPISFDKSQIVTLQSRKLPVDKEGKVPKRKKVGVIDMLSAELANYEGEYFHYSDREKRWDATPGDFCQIIFTLPSGVWVMLQNEEGGWIKPSEQIKLPQSAKVSKHEYGIILDIGSGNHILALTGYKYTDAPSFLTLICVTPDNADMVFNKKVDLLSIEETSEGYRLLGRTMEEEGEQVIWQPCEISIERGELVFKILE